MRTEPSQEPTFVLYLGLVFEGIDRLHKLCEVMEFFMNLVGLAN
ncbi:hypothetical protein [Ochrobactrum soli]|nr:hypothetical protein [[Ochrobactrum] soli]